MKFVADGICFSYNSNPVLSNVSFKITGGEMVCILGVNGAGKSTLLKCLNRILSPQQGAVLLDEKELFNMSRVGVARCIGYVPQRHSESYMNVFETVLIGRKPHMGWKAGTDDYAIVESILRRIGLESLSMRRVCDLSGGQLQKVIIARALAQTPKILLLDEPTSNLDMKNQLDVMGLIQEISKNHRISTIIAIHDLNIAVRFAERFFFLKEGQVYSISTRKTLSAEVIREVYGIDVVLKEFEGHTIVVPI